MTPPAVQMLQQMIATTHCTQWHTLVHVRTHTPRHNHGRTRALAGILASMRKHDLFSFHAQSSGSSNTLILPPILGKAEFAVCDRNQKEEQSALWAARTGQIATIHGSVKWDPVEKSFRCAYASSYISVPLNLMPVLVPDSPRN